jgi:TonB family protein
MRKFLWMVPALALAATVLISPGWGQQTSNQPASPAGTPEKVAVSAGVVAALRTGGDLPRYPAIAKAAQVQGTVVLHATISAQGTIDDLRVISGPPMLQQAAMDAVRTWTYRPYLLSGQPVRVETLVNVVFSLPQPEAASAPGATDAGAQAQQDSAANPPPEHPITTAQVHEMMELTGSVNLTKQMLDSMMPMLRQSMPPYMPADVMQDFEQTFTGGALEDAVVSSYQAHLSTEDAAEIIAFYKSPAGRRMLAAMPAIVVDCQKAGQQLGVQVMQQVLEKHKDEIESAKKAYEAQHSLTIPKD